MKTFVAEVVQYMRPHGRKELKQTTLPEEYKPAYDAMRAAGFHLTAEELMTMEVSLTVSNDKMDADIEIVPNGPKVPDAICKMLARKAWEYAGAPA